MSTRERLRELIELTGKNLFVRIIVGIVSGLTAYLEFANAGWTPLFFVLVGLALVAAVLVAVPLVRSLLQRQWRRWFESAKPYYDEQSRIEILADLIEEFETIEKAKALADATKGRASIQVLAILPVENAIGVLIDVGQQEDVKVGTRLLVYRTDERTPEGHQIEKAIAIARVTYVQAGNNCSQAVITERLDREFWDQTQERLQKEKRVSPPRNFATPYIPDGLSDLSIDNVATIRKYLGAVQSFLTRKTADRISSEE